MKRTLAISLVLFAGFTVAFLQPVSAASNAGPKTEGGSSASSTGATTHNASATGSKHRRTIDADEAYKNNCMRCHTGLPQYSPRMNKTILMHMRVDANIPGDEADAILEYLRGAN